MHRYEGRYAHNLGSVKKVIAMRIVCWLLCAYLNATEAQPPPRMPRLQLYVKDSATVKKAEELCKRRGVNSISELFARLVTAEDRRKRGVTRGMRRKAEVAS